MITTANTAFRGHPFQPCKASAPSNRVVYVGTFAKILFPAMRLGFLVVPEAFREGIVSALSVTGQFAPLVTQAALADFINEGHFARHLRRMRRLYAARRQYFMDICEDYLSPWLRLRRTESGIQLVGLFHGDHDDKAVARAALDQGVNVSPLSIQYRHSHVQRGLLMGFAAADEKTTKKAMGKLRDVLRTAMLNPIRINYELLKTKHFPEVLHLVLRYAHFVARLRIGARFHVSGKFRKSRNALLLQAGTLRGKIAVALGMPGVMARIAAKHILGEKILGIAARSRAHGNHEQRRAL